MRFFCLPGLLPGGECELKEGPEPDFTKSVLPCWRAHPEGVGQEKGSVCVPVWSILGRDFTAEKYLRELGKSCCWWTMQEVLAAQLGR